MQVNHFLVRVTVLLYSRRVFFTSLCGNMKFLVKRGTQDILTAIDKISQHTSDSLLCSMVVKKLPAFRFSYFDIFN